MSPTPYIGHQISTHENLDDLHLKMHPAPPNKKQNLLRDWRDLEGGGSEHTLYFELTFLCLLDVSACHYDKVLAGTNKGLGTVKSKTGRGSCDHHELTGANLDAPENLRELLVLAAEIKLLGKLCLCKHSRPLGRRRCLLGERAGEGHLEDAAPRFCVGAGGIRCVWRERDRKHGEGGSCGDEGC